MSQKQSIVFFTNKGWNESSARKWLKIHNLIPIKSVDKHLPNQLRYRLVNPDKFKRFRTIATNDGINIIIGFN